MLRRFGPFFSALVVVMYTVCLVGCTGLEEEGTGSSQGSVSETGSSGSGLNLTDGGETDPASDGGSGTEENATGCVPACEGKECGDDGCGGECGECPEIAPYCVAGICAFECTPDCDGKACGDDGCGDSCGACVDGTLCQEGLCACVPDCGGKECGEDGCGGSCGTCADEAPYCLSGVCSAECTPQCDDKECGDDGCGGECGQCPSVAPYCIDGSCALDCAPDCEGKACGDDGCGGDCGQCEDAQICVSGSCVCAPQCDDKDCGEDGCGGSCGECPSAAPYCIDSLCESDCTPQCAGKECGDDSCGGHCGICPEVAPLCGDDGTCQFDCTPDCADKECGDDGCGGSCGECAADEACTVGGACIAIEEEEVVNCNPITQTGCAEGENCTYVGADEDGATCVPAGETPVGGECSSTTDCVEGICMSLNEMGSLCYKFCKTVGHCPGLVECLDLENASYSVCKVDDIYDYCGLMDPAGCETGKACYVIDGEDSPVCLPEGSAGQGDECDDPGDCSGGHACINHKCLTLCNQNVTNPCGEFIACSYYYGNIGYCDQGGSGCTPSCFGKECGDDGCGGSCGYCGGAYACNATGQCEPWCQLWCDTLGYECGSDGCGGQCGTCSFGYTCTAGQCVSDGCGNGVCEENENCENCAADCGACTGGCCSAKSFPGCDDDAIETCVCAADSYCCTNSWDNLCVSQAQSQCGGCDQGDSGCTPSCFGKECGADGCGGSCGDCSASEVCTSGGACVALCDDWCDALGYECGSDGCGDVCGTCWPGQTCLGGECIGDCLNQCAGKECGDDGCGGSCGSCAENKLCSTSGVCVLDPAAGCGGLDLAEDWVGVFDGDYQAVAFNGLYADDGDLDGELSFSIVCLNSKLVVNGAMWGLAKGENPFSLVLMGTYNPETNELDCTVTEGELYLEDLLQMTIAFEGVMPGTLGPDGKFSGTFAVEGISADYALGAVDINQVSASAFGTWLAEPAP